MTLYAILGSVSVAALALVVILGKWLHEAHQKDMEDRDWEKWLLNESKTILEEKKEYKQ